MEAIRRVERRYKFDVMTRFGIGENYLTNADVKDPNKAMSKFTWASKRPKVKPHTLQSPTATGGRSRPNSVRPMQASVLLDCIRKPEDAR